MVGGKPGHTALLEDGTSSISLSTCTGENLAVFDAVRALTVLN